MTWKKETISSDNGSGATGTLVNASWSWKCKMKHPCWKTVRQSLRSLRICLPCDPPIPFPGKYLSEMKTMFPQKPVTKVTKVVCEPAKEWKLETSVMLLPGERRSTLWFNHAMECRSAMSMEGLVTYNNADGLKCIVWGDRSQNQKAPCMVPFLWHPCVDPALGTDSWSVVSGVVVQGALTAKGPWESVDNDGKVINRDGGSA